MRDARSHERQKVARPQPDVQFLLDLFLITTLFSGR
jgi:hypothetical protein